MLIGIVGVKGAGKDTVADYLVQNHGFVKESFAKNLKRACKEMFMLTDEQLNDPVLKETPDERWFGATPRSMMQFIGTDLFRNQLNEIMPGIGANVHVHAFELWYLQNKHKNIVLADVRFENEAKVVRDNGGTLVRIVRSDNTVYASGDIHASETAQVAITCNRTIDNNGTKAELYKQIEDMISSS